MDSEFDEQFDEQAYKSFVKFLRAFTEARSVADMQIAAGVLLQDLGEEPDDV